MSKRGLPNHLRKIVEKPSGYRYGFTEAQLKAMTPAQAKAIEDCWFPLKRRIFPQFISNDIIRLD